jgi:hypothetical protein
MLIDDFSSQISSLGTSWRLVSDRVMGGVSGGTMARNRVAGRSCVCLRGAVSVENNGGFLQLAIDLQPAGLLNATAYEGIELMVRGNGEQYSLHLKTGDVRLPWQSYRQSFETTPDWRSLRLPFAEFAAHRIEYPLDVSRLRRLGIVAIGRPMSVDLCVAELRFY